MWNIPSVDVSVIRWAAPSFKASICSTAGLDREITVMSAHLSELKILYADDDIIAVDKPSDIFVHPTNLDRSDKYSVTDMLRRQLDEVVYPLHRLDRPTSGCLLFGRHKECVRRMSYQFTQRAVHKRYVALLRGHLENTGVIDYDLRRKNRTQTQPAITKWTVHHQGELDRAIPPHNTARYSLVELQPETGRWHQLRRHCAHIRHPIIGDTSHGDARHNRLFRELIGEKRLLLHATTLAFQHPLKPDKYCHVTSPLPNIFNKIASVFGWSVTDVLLNDEAQLV